MAAPKLSELALAVIVEPQSELHYRTVHYQIREKWETKKEEIKKRCICGTTEVSQEA